LTVTTGKRRGLVGTAALYGGFARPSLSQLGDVFGKPPITPPQPDDRQQNLLDL
jgi:hypothetical protein